MSTPRPPQCEWREAVIGYAQAINEHVAKGLRDGWDTVGEAPNLAPTQHLLPHLREALQRINEPGTDAAHHATFRQEWPPAYAPLIPLLDQESLKIGELALLDDGALLARIGAPYEPGHVVLIEDDRVTTVEGVDYFGRCPARRFFARANARGITITDGWYGPRVASLSWPTGLEDLPEGFAIAPLEQPPIPTQLIPFPDGRRALLVSSDGIFVLAEQGARRLHPSRQDVLDGMRQGHLKAEDGLPECAMEHGAISPDGHWVAVGSQMSSHQVFDAELNPVASIGPAGEYPHFALFNQRSDMAIFNACHFFNGATLGVATRNLPGLETDFYSDDPRTPTLQDGARVFSGVHRGDEFIIGDAYGYLRAFSEKGETRWQHFIGSTLGALDISADGKTLVVGSCAGFIVFIQLDSGRKEPWQIGTGEHREFRHWVFWKGFERPLLW